MLPSIPSLYFPNDVQLEDFDLSLTTSELSCIAKTHQSNHSMPQD